MSIDALANTHESPLQFAADQVARASLDHCVKCTICETQCPVARVTDLFPGPKYVGPQAERFRHGESVDHSLDYCSSCGICTYACPQGVKIAELNSQARAVLKDQPGKMPIRDRLITQTKLMGMAMTPVAPIANWALNQKPIRTIVEKTIKIHRDAPMPVATSQSFMGWWKKREKPTNSPLGPVVFFHGCAGAYFEVETSKRTVEVLEHLGYEVIVPKQGCCGLAQQSNGLFDEAKKSVINLSNALRSAGRDLTIISSSGSCAGMLKHEAHLIMGVDDPALLDVGTRMRETAEFLIEQIEIGVLDPAKFREINDSVTYHQPCQVKSQGMGIPTITLLETIPGLTVKESGENCCGIAGTYGLKAEKYDIAQLVGQPLFDKIKAWSPQLAVCETETCRWQIRKGSGAKVVHPVNLIHYALGLSNDLYDPNAKH
ncbi:anaerobic glycerol-3-phosphate dehydrogenase subunit C [Flaviflexus huanghaiensis]|uniref:anaerobic glycerol-3-phosphate dehydrogenase subunit C n=1 Tax=Flaviflexus huanghaiensis TaxID=1111473 RepID=UPI0015FA9CAF|nr:anaerobic glycerol-3-phosphate dehydrogenase subunit C [Flaviflexus huanghaiensis]